MGCLNTRTFFKFGCFWQDQVSRTIWHGPNMFMDVLIGPKFQWHFGMDQMPPWAFWTGPKFNDLLVWVGTKCLHGCFGQDQIPCKALSSVNSLKTIQHSLIGKHWNHTCNTGNLICIPFNKKLIPHDKEYLEYFRFLFEKMPNSYINSLICIDARENPK